MLTWIYATRRRRRHTVESEHRFYLKLMRVRADRNVCAETQFSHTGTVIGVLPPRRRYRCAHMNPVYVNCHMHSHSPNTLTCFILSLCYPGRTNYTLFWPFYKNYHSYSFHTSFYTLCCRTLRTHCRPQAD